MAFDSGWYSGSVVSGSEELAGISKNRPTSDQLREYINNELQNTDAAISRQKAADDFVALYKPRGYKDTAANAKQLMNALSLLGKSNPTIPDLEDIYTRLVANGMLDLDQTKLSASQKQEEQKRVAQYLENQFDEEKAYSMDMQTLERRARGW